jgi:pectinesterase
VTGSSQRPQLTASSVQNFTVQKYLANGGTTDSFVLDNWDPSAGLGDVNSFIPTYTVASDGSGTHTTIREALDAAKASSDTARAYILLKSGTYREALCIDQNRPITLYGLSSDASAVGIVFGNNGGKTTDTGVNPCAPTGNSTYGIAGSATLGINSKEVHLKNVSIINDFNEGADMWASGLQGAALYTQGDRLVLENVRISGNQSTTQFYSLTEKSIARVYLKNSLVSGDVQFIVGRATVVFDNCEIRSVTDRVQPPLGSIVSASTPAKNPYGMLFVNSQFTIGTTSNSNWVLLGRSWDEGAATYVAGTSPNGQVVIRECAMASHIKKTSPWGNALESSRIYDCHGNRLYEYANTGDGAAP